MKEDFLSFTLAPNAEMHARETGVAKTLAISTQNIDSYFRAKK
jgi:hypothetical protein